MSEEALLDYDEDCDEHETHERDEHRRADHSSSADEDVTSRKDHCPRLRDWLISHGYNVFNCGLLNQFYQDGHEDCRGHIVKQIKTYGADYGLTLSNNCIVLLNPSADSSQQPVELHDHNSQRMKDNCRRLRDWLISRNLTRIHTTGLGPFYADGHEDCRQKMKIDKYGAEYGLYVINHIILLSTDGKPEAPSESLPSQSEVEPEPQPPVQPQKRSKSTSEFDWKDNCRRLRDWLISRNLTHISATGLGPFYIDGNEDCRQKIKVEKYGAEFGLTLTANNVITLVDGTSNEELQAQVSKQEQAPIAPVVSFSSSEEMFKDCCRRLRDWLISRNLTHISATGLGPFYADGHEDCRQKIKVEKYGVDYGLTRVQDMIVLAGYEESATASQQQQPQRMHVSPEDREMDLKDKCRRLREWLVSHDLRHIHACGLGPFYKDGNEDCRQKIKIEKYGAEFGLSLINSIITLTPDDEPRKRTRSVADEDEMEIEDTPGEYCDSDLYDDQMMDSKRRRLPHDDAECIDRELEIM
jgi:hypothetical protein